MFPLRYFTFRYFTGWFWAKIGAEGSSLPPIKQAAATLVQPLGYAAMLVQPVGYEAAEVA